MSILRGCSALVIRCFKRVEHFADWITGAAGPYFVFLCWTLIVLGGVGFCPYLFIIQRPIFWADKQARSRYSSPGIGIYRQNYPITHLHPCPTKLVWTILPCNSHSTRISIATSSGVITTKTSDNAE